jgi:CsoR family transcriptional regulator, copper-sensing transcriptional repressor
MTTSRSTSDPTDPGYVAAGEKDGILNRLRRVEGQVRGIAGMVEQDRYCTGAKRAELMTALTRLVGRR